jgi:hypothetical protein
MTRMNLQNKTVAQLVQEFIANTLAQYEAHLDEAHSRYNRLFKEMGLLQDELKRRPGDQRCALVPLCDHENSHVRLQAAIATLAIAPEKARQTLQVIKDRDEYPDAPNAFGMLRALDRGTYVPD